MEFKSLFFRKGIQIINYEPSAKGSFDDFEIIEIKSKYGGERELLSDFIVKKSGATLRITPSLTLRFTFKILILL